VPSFARRTNGRAKQPKCLCRACGRHFGFLLLCDLNRANYHILFFLRRLSSVFAFCFLARILKIFKYVNQF
jgi:hypothetical protein